MSGACTLMDDVSSVSARHLGRWVKSAMRASTRVAVQSRLLDATSAPTSVVSLRCVPALSITRQYYQLAQRGLFHGKIVMAVKAASDINMSFVLEHFDGDDQRTLYDVGLQGEALFSDHRSGCVFSLLRVR